MFFLLLLLLLFFLQDIYYANNKELIKKKLLPKFQTTLVTEGEKKLEKGKSIAWYLQLSTFHNYIRYSQKTAAQFLKSGLFYK